MSNFFYRFLPAARLTIKPKKGSANSNTDTADHDAVNEEAKKKRLELCIGVNALTRGIKDDKVAAALIAGDITPSQLAAHLNFKCTRKNIPYLYVSNMRQYINDALGFPCIALGFKKGCDSFVKIVKKISKLHKQLKQDDENLVEEVQKESESEEENSALIENTSQVRKEPEKLVFSYLYRSSYEERVFIPEEVGQRAKQTDNNFIAFNTDEKEVKKVMKERWNAAPGISHNIIKKFKKEKKLKFKNEEVEGIGINETEEVPKKKVKKDWVIDKKQSKVNLKYSPANVIKYHSNVDRKEKVKIKKKKIFQPPKNQI